MLKLLLAAGVVLNLAVAQRSFYAPRPGSNSRLLPRFREKETESNLDTRGGQEDSDSLRTSTTLLPELQGTLEDHEFVHRVSQWPEERQPFWFKNRHAISSMRNRDIDGGNANRRGTRPSLQSSFKGPSSNSRTRVSVQPLSNEPFFNSNLISNGYDSDPLVLYLRKIRRI